LKSQQVVHLDNFTALVSKTGTRIPIGDSTSPLKRLSGETLGAVVVFWDMSDRRQTELLSQALEKEQQLNQLKSQFVSTVSHEFRNPLAIIRTATELLGLRQNLTDTQKNAYLQRIKTSVRSMNQLMEDVLFMGQAEADRLVCQPAPIHLEQFCQDLAEEFLMFDGSSHTIVFNSQGDCQNVWMDEKLLRYILTNLLSNAIKYSPPNTTVQLSLRIDSAERIATFLVQDHGIGIPEAEQIQLFESFFRATNVTSIQGTGLGLAIVKRCVEAHSGQIHLTSQVGIGTTVSVTLPLDLAP
jgi:signal transduction histidine kinase